MNKILITGCNGQVGWELQRSLAPLGKIFAFDRFSLDLSNKDTIRQTVRSINPNIIVNAGAYTAVDKAENDFEMSLALNGTAPEILAEEAKRINAILIHYSTDYVFDGSADDSYHERSPTNPLNAYGKTKLAGETAIQVVGGNYLILRTSWVYASRGKNFLLTMLKLAKERDTLKIVQDQIGAPTWSRMIAEATAYILSQTFFSRHNNIWGIYNLTCSGKTSWLGFADAIFRLHSKKYPGVFNSPKLIGIPSSDYPTPTLRPKNSLLCPLKLQKTFCVHMPDWEKALELCMAEI